MPELVHTLPSTTHRALGTQVIGKSLVDSLSEIQYFRADIENERPLTWTDLKENLFVVAFFPFRTPVPDRIHEPVQTLKIYRAPGACFLMKLISEAGTTPGLAPGPGVHSA
jgi:hypothetical protein